MRVCAFQKVANRKGVLMAQRLNINLGMVDALKKQLRIENCPVCGWGIDEHSWIAVKGFGRQAEITWCNKKGNR